jgi:hypothetical protein
MEIDAAENYLLFVIRTTNITETKMKAVINEYLQIPAERRSFAEEFLLHNSSVSFAAKAKLILAIANELNVKIDKNDMHTMLSRRNAFAHQDHLSSIRVVKDHNGVPEVSYVVESIKGAGQLEVVTQKQAYEEFVKAHFVVERGLDALAARLSKAVK